ncbi:MAG: 3-isopropylmalate dehydratase small subunit [Gammaproteobacteria bacterium]|nr:MAG: 3-isopropylmalate dehydratase small subunit [Gammaproteobacteria bacterium]
MKKFHTLTSRAVTLDEKDVDTDQIIPARFLKTTSKYGLGEHLFEDWRKNPDGSKKPDFVFNRPDVQGAQILLTGSNFGCGSSREHAPWALMDWGFKAIVSTSYADIFQNNSIKNGLLPVAIDESKYSELLDLVEESPNLEITIDLGAQSITYGNGHHAEFDIDPFAKLSLMEGVDQLGYLLSMDEKITEFEAKHDQV